MKKFTQMNNDALSLHIKMVKTNPAAAALILYLIKEMRPMDNCITCSFKVLESGTGFTRQALTSAIHYLESIRWLKVYKSGRTNIYAINSEVAWKYHQNDTWRAKFSATIILDSEEQSNLEQSNFGTVKQLVNLNDLREFYGGTDE